MTTKRAAIYLRAPDDDTQGLDLASQEQLLREWAEHRGDAVVKVYADIGAGRLEPRPGLGQLMADAEAGLLDVVLIQDPARLFLHCLLCCLCYSRLRHEFGMEVAFYRPQCPVIGDAS